MKRCSICKEEKELNEFNKRKGSKDGLQKECRICQKQYYQRNKEKIKAYKNQYYLRNKERRREYSKEYNKDYHRRNPEKYKARQKLNKAVQRGKIHKPLYCSSCDSDKHLEAHHTDYSKPLEVMWLCRTCHRELHNKMREQSRI